jgi:acylphosphatase
MIAALTVAASGLAAFTAGPTAASALTAPMPIARRAAIARMGGFEQKYFGKDGTRLALLISDAPAVSADEVSKACAAMDGLTGVVYAMDDRVELVAEGSKELLEKLKGDMQQLAGPSAQLREVSQGSVGGYKATFPVVEMKPKMHATVEMRAGKEDLDYMARHFQIEAVFNRGLKLEKMRPGPEKAVLKVSGPMKRVKSFVRWCYLGPQLRRPESVTVEWREAA